MDTINSYISRVERAIIKAETNNTKLPDSVFSINGMSARKNRIFLNELLSEDSNSYLEIGTWLGSTFVSGLYRNSLKKAIAIDNFSQFDGNKNEFFSNCVKNGIYIFDFISADCFNLTQEQISTIKDINIYFYDGDHKHEDQEMALTYYIDCLQKEFILIIDDWNHEPVRTGTRSGLEKTQIKVHKEWILPANYNGDTENWWNGLYVAVGEK